MRRTVLIAVVLLLGLAAAAPALAQTRDPFEPQPGGGQEQDTGTGDTATGDDPFEPETDEQRAAQEEPDDPTVAPTTDPSPIEEPDPQSTVQGGTLSNTGFEVATWSGIAYLLMIAGAAALVLAWMFAPAAHRRRK
jgi:hypothetical protein